MQAINLSAIKLDKIELPSFEQKGIEASVLRLDKIHPLISGNKWFKLQYYLQEAKQLQKQHIVTYGGAWSNHILATAAICKLEGLRCTGIIRGEDTATPSATLIQARALGMELFFMDRETYSDKKLPDAFSGDDYYLIAEGGYGPNGAKGAAGILDHCETGSFTHICCAAGTGTMAAGLLLGSSLPEIIAVSVLKNHRRMGDNIAALTPSSGTPTIIHDYHFGGYAKYTPALLTLMNELYRKTNIPTDFVYTGKLFFAVNDLVQQSYFPPGSRLLIIHSGGLQGNASLGKGTLIF